MKKILFFICVMLFFLSSCKKTTDVEDGKATIPTYNRNTSEIRLIENANLYRISFSEEGFFYYVTIDAEDAEVLQYDFYYQSFQEENVSLICTVRGGYVRDFHGTVIDGKVKLWVLQGGDENYVLEYGQDGELCSKTELDKALNDQGKLVRFLVNPNGGLLVGMDDQIYLINENGQLMEKIKVDGIVRELYDFHEHGIYVIFEKDNHNNSHFDLAKVDVKKKLTEDVRELPNGISEVYAFEGGFAYVSDKEIIYFMNGKEDSILVDLDKQGIIASRIRYVFESEDKINLVSMNASVQEGKINLYVLEKKAQGEKNETDRTLFTDDGRRKVLVAVPKKYNCQIEFHAKEYNQTSDESYIEVIRFEETLEEYLGKGNEPDIIMFADNTEIGDYVKKGVLTDLIPLFREQEEYSAKDIVPKARELLGLNESDAMYAMAGWFWLLIRTSDGSEYDSDKECDTVKYLKWYDAFMTENGYEGVGKLQNVLYANVPLFYDEKSATAFFDSLAFRELLTTYREIMASHTGNVGIIEGSIRNQMIAYGPRWYASYVRYELTEPNTAMEGVPCIDGQDHVYMRFDYPMSILSISDCKSEAFHFIMYYNSLAEPLAKGDSESSYGKNGNTLARFSVFEENLRTEIYESKRPYSSLGQQESFFTEEQIVHLKELIDCAEAETKTQRDIYGIVEEEIAYYLLGKKDLEETIEIIQNRACLYLNENK